MPNGLAQTLQSGMVKKQSEWEDMNYDERTQKLMEVCSQLHAQVGILERKVEALQSQVVEHRHDEKGEPFIKEYLNGLGMAKTSSWSPLPDRVYVNTNPFNRKALKVKSEEQEETFY